MREIEFRGKINNNKDWVYGYYKRIGDKHYILKKQNKSVYDIKWEWIDWIRVDPKTVGQYTGRKDKNDKKIFEMDILQSPVPNFKYPVRYNSKVGAFMAISGMVNYSASLWETGTILGNEVDNPEIIPETVKEK